MRVRGEFDRVLDGVRNLRDAGVPIEINFSPARFNLHEVDAVVDLAYELGAYSFYTGRTMYTGNAVKAWRHLEVTERQYVAYFDALRRRPRSTAAACASTSTRPGCSRSCAIASSTRRPADRAAQRPGQAHQRPALHLRRLPARQPRRDLGRFRSAWHDPRVAGFVDDLAADPGRTRTCTNGSISEPRADRAVGAGRSAWQRLLRVCALVRYRFFLYAGLLPYLLGAAWAYAIADAFDGTIFLSGLAGVVLAVVGVEAFNEYFDSRMGTDRVFNPPTCRR
jgi:hypothetical protein